MEALTLTSQAPRPLTTNLGPIWTNLSPPPRKQGAESSDKGKLDRALRYRMRHASQSITEAKGVRRCGRVPAGIGHQGSVSLRAHQASRRAYFAGLERCNNPWQCAVCVVRIQAGRCAELRGLDHAHRAAKGGVLMATLTFPHDLVNELARLKKTAVKAWQYCITGAPWQRQQAALGVLGYVRALEVTDGPNGWHLHFHVVLYTQRSPAPAELEAFRVWLLARWSKAITRRQAFRRPSAEHGVTVESCRDASYIAKMGLAAELTLSGTKRARPGHRTPMQLLRDLTLTTDRRRRALDAARWREWCHAMHGARQLTWSAGMRMLAGWYQVNLTADDAALPDPAPAPELPLPMERAEPEPDSVIVYEFEPEEWSQLMSSRRSVSIRLQLLDVVEHPPDEWADRAVKILDAAFGLAPIPF